MPHVEPAGPTPAPTRPLADPLLEYLFDDAVLLSAAPQPTSVAHALDGHRYRLQGDLAHLMGPLLVPADLAEPFAEALTAEDDALRVLLVAPDGTDAGRNRLRAARDLLAEDERVAIVGVRIGIPPGPPALMTAALLTMLDFTAPSWIEVTPGPDASEVLRGVASDGAEALTVMATRTTPGTAGGPDDDLALAFLIRTLIDDGETFRVALAPVSAPLVRTDRRHGVLNLLAAVHAGMHDGSPAQLAQILAVRDLGSLAPVLQRLTDVEAAMTRSYLASVEVVDVAAAVAELLAAGLVAPEA